MDYFNVQVCLFILHYFFKEDGVNFKYACVRACVCARAFIWGDG